MQTQHPFLFSCKLEGEQRLLDESQAIAEAESDRLAWVSLDADNDDTSDWLARNVTYLNPIIIEALLADETRPRCEVIDDGVMLILRGVNLAEGAEPEDMVSIRLWVDAERVISMQKRPLRAVDKLMSQYQHQAGPRTVANFLSELISNLLDVMEPVLTEIDDRVDDLEEELMLSPSSALRHELALLRRRALQLKRYISPQRDAIATLRNSQMSWITIEDRMHLQESHDRITRFVEHLDSIRERCQIIQDELSTVMADRLNRNTYLLTIIAAIFLPLGFITGLLGMNVGGIPATDNHEGFALVCALCAALFIGEILVFKKLKWL